jgi:hypothetical protein
MPSEAKHLPSATQVLRCAQDDIILVMPSEAKHLASATQVLRCAQDDIILVMLALRSISLPDQNSKTVRLIPSENPCHPEFTRAFPFFRAMLN